MTLIATTLLLGMLALLLCVAALGDIRTYRIPNTLNLTIAGLAIPYWLVNASAGWASVAPLLLPQAVLIGTVFIIMLTLMLLNIIGGGDAKLLFALAFWLQPEAYLNMVLLTSVAGGVLSLWVLVQRRRSAVAAAPDMDGVPTDVKRKQRVPYGVAIAAGAIVPVSQLILNALLVHTVP
jgi:prepilin peptidase CpaA